ncbi:ligand-gated ion channel [Mucilaginibacter gynuensis]|uniref:Ligand-gated ion channel n=1 Tax=Mucilaginibacter gynuensis TaxID=1302236 RepID=A0ABP8FPS6_9SPHI
MKIKILAVITILFSLTANAQKTKPDTVKTGIYITSIHNINFKDKEYTINLWLWMKYKNKDFDFEHNLEVPLAKTVDKAFSTVDTTNGQIYLMMKLQCVMKDTWAIDNFPFDKQTLRFSIENSQFDSDALVFVPDTLGKHFDPRFTLRGWTIDSIKVSNDIKVYETGFGDESLTKPHTEYSSFKTKLVIHRDAMGLFWKMFLGMYVAFLIAYMCFYIHADSIDSRFGLSVGSLFAVIGNKYIIDASLPDSTTFTLVDTLHGITLLFILAVIICTAYTLKFIKEDKLKQSRRFDFLAAQVLLFTYIILNVYFIYTATRV